jgi:hypothetical protein
MTAAGLAPIPWEPPDLYPKQYNAIYSEARFSFIEASTKSGKTVGCMTWLFEQALRYGKEGQEFWWVAPVYGQAKIAYRRIKQGLNRKDLMDCNDGDLTITLIHNRAVLRFKSGEKPDNLYGEDVYACVIDEASRLREESWHAIVSTLTATQGMCRVIGNVKGRKNWFYKLAVMAKAGNFPSGEYHKITAYDAIRANVIEREVVEDARKVLPRSVFLELYLAKASEDGSNPFSLRHIRSIVQDDLSPNPALCWGWDLARKLDWTVGIGLDFEGKISKFVRFKGPWRRQIQTIIESTAGAPAYVDATGVGDAVIDRIQEIAGDNFHPYVFSSTSKQIIMEGLAVAIQTQDIGVIDGPLRDELKEFTFEYTRTGVRYTAPEGYHDDCVCALALANHMRHSPDIFRPMEVH